MNRSELALLLKEHNQEHLLSYYEKLSQDNKDNLTAQIEKVDWRLIDFIHQDNQRQKSRLYQPLEGMDKEQANFDRENEFAPVKNSVGVDSINTAQQLLMEHGYEL